MVSSARRTKTVFSIVEVNSHVAPFFKKGCDGAYTASNFRQKLAAVPPSKLGNYLISGENDMRKKAAARSLLGRTPASEIR